MSLETKDILAALNITSEDVLARVAHDLRDEFDGSVRDLFREQVQAIAKQAAPKIIEAHLNLAIDNIVNGQYQPVNEWGEAKGPKTSLREMVQSRCVSYLNDKVNSRGETASYDTVGTRAQWLANESAKKSFDVDIKAHVVKEIAAAKEQIKTMLGKHIAETLLKS